MSILELPNLIAAGAVVFLVAIWVIVRHRRAVKTPPGLLVLPQIEMAKPRTRLAKGSLAFAAAVDPFDGIARRPLRPTHTRRTAT